MSVQLGGSKEKEQDKSRNLKLPRLRDASWALGTNASDDDHRCARASSSQPTKRLSLTNNIGLYYILMNINPCKYEADDSKLDVQCVRCSPLWSVGHRDGSEGCTDGGLSLFQW